MFLGMDRIRFEGVTETGVQLPTAREVGDMNIKFSYSEESRLQESGIHIVIVHPKDCLVL